MQTSRPTLNRQCSIVYNILYCTILHYRFVISQNTTRIRRYSKSNFHVLDSEYSRWTNANAPTLLVEDGVLLFYMKVLDSSVIKCMCIYIYKERERESII